MPSNLKRIFNFLSRLFVRLAHVFEHVICDDVPSVVFDEDDIEPTDPVDLFDDDEEL